MKSFERFLVEGPDTPKAKVVEEHNLYEEATGKIFVFPPFVGGTPSGLTPGMTPGALLDIVMPLGYANPREILTWGILDVAKYGSSDIARSISQKWGKFKPAPAHAQFADCFGDSPSGIDSHPEMTPGKSYYFSFPSNENPNGFWIGQSSGAKLKVVCQLPEINQRVAGGGQPVAPANPAPNPQTAATAEQEAGKPVVGDGKADTLQELGIEKDADYGRAAVKAESKYRLEQLDRMLANPASVTQANGKANISRILSAKAAVVKAGGSLKQQVDKFEAILTHAMRYRTGVEKLAILIGGDPGVGKTTFLKQFGRLTGVPVAVVEAPHVVKENLVRIPFLVYKGEQSKSGSVDAALGADGQPVMSSVSEEIQRAEDTLVKNSDGAGKFQVQLASSSLVTTLNQLKPLTDAAWKKGLSRKKAFYDMIQERPKLLAAIVAFRAAYSNILFLDEYFRTDNKTIRNILHGVINGRIGSQSIPRHTYVIFAANLNNDDGSFDDIPDNIQVVGMDFDLPDHKDWGNYFKNKYQFGKAEAVELKRMVEDPDGGADEDDRSEWVHGAETRELAALPFDIDASFTDKLVDAVGEDLAKATKVEGGSEEVYIRLSPRRMEELTISLNALITTPPSEARAKQILTFLRIQLRDYKTGLVNEKLYEKMAKVVIESMEAKGIKGLSPKSVSSPTQWENMLELQLDLKDRLGGLRKYVPMVAGSPGIGKTQIIKKTAIKRNMMTIEIEASTITRESLFGIPVEDRSLNNRGVEELGVKFSSPPLYVQIMDEYKKNKARMEKQGTKPTGHYSQILFVDEVTRVDDKNIFNGLRRLLLEGEFSAEYRLPSDLMIVGALNPVDASGSTEDMTSHFKDVVDVIPGEADFNVWFESYLLPRSRMDDDKQKRHVEELQRKGLSPEAMEMAMADARRNGLDFGVETGPVIAQALGWLARQKQSKWGMINGNDAEPVELDPPMQPWWWVGGQAPSDVLYTSPRTMDEIYVQWTANINAYLHDIGYGVEDYDPKEQTEIKQTIALLCIEGLDAAFKTIAALKAGAVWSVVKDICAKLIGSKAFQDFFNPLFVKTSAIKVDLTDYLKSNGYSLKKVGLKDFVAFVDGADSEADVVSTMARVFDDLSDQFAANDAFDVVRKYNPILTRMGEALTNMSVNSSSKIEANSAKQNIGIMSVGRFRTLWPFFKGKTQIIEEVIKGVHDQIVNETYDLVKDQIEMAVK